MRVHTTSRFNFDSASRQLDSRDLYQILDTDTDMGAAFADAVVPFVDDAIEATDEYVTTWVLKGDGIDLTGAVDCTTALRARFTDGLAAGAKRFSGVPGATYKISIPHAQSLATFTGTEGITVDMSNSIIENLYEYSIDTITPIFMLDGAIDTTVLLQEYVGYTPNMAYGATLVRAINGASGVVVDAKITNARYGVQTGNYATPSEGQCSDFNLRIRGSMIGYPLAAYFADGIKHDIDVVGVHRGVYIAGCNDVRGTLRWKDQYGADTVYLMTDCLTSGTDAAAQLDPVGDATTSRGCSNVDVVSIDKGSDDFEPSTSCAGILLSRVDDVEFRNIRVGVYTVGTDTVSTRVGGWRVMSGAKAVWNRYPYNWEPGVVFENIEIYGIVDHSACTLPGNTGHEFYMVTYESTTAHSAVLRNFRTNGFSFYPATPNTSTLRFDCPGVEGSVLFEGFNSPSAPLSVLVNLTSDIIFSRCIIDELIDVGVGGGNRMVLTNGTIITQEAYTKGVTGTIADGGKQGGVGIQTKTVEFTVELTGASVTVTPAIPAGAIVKAVVGRLQSAITGSNGYSVGVSGDVTRYANRTFTTTGTFGPQHSAVTETGPRLYQSATDLVVTAHTGNFSGGTLRLAVHYEIASLPTV